MNKLTHILDAISIFGSYHGRNPSARPLYPYNLWQSSGAKSPDGGSYTKSGPGRRHKSGPGRQDLQGRIDRKLGGQR